MWKVVRIVLTLSFTGILWYLQEIPGSSKEWYDIFLRAHKYPVFCFALAGDLLTQVTSYLIKTYKTGSITKQWVKKLLEHIVQERLGGRNYQTRISLLRPQKGYKLWWFYLVKMPVYNKLNGRNLPDWKTFKKNIPSAFKEYLYVYTRYGHSDDHKSLHYFRYLIAMSCLMVLQINVSRSNKNKMFKQLAFLICIFLRHTRKQKRIESCLLT